MSAEFRVIEGNTSILVYRCDDAAGFELRVVRANDGDFHLSVCPRLTDFDDPDEASMYSPCYMASVRIRMPMIGGGAHDDLYHALAKLHAKARKQAR